MWLLLCFSCCLCLLFGSAAAAAAAAVVVVVCLFVFGGDFFFWGGGGGEGGYAFVCHFMSITFASVVFFSFFDTLIPICNDIFFCSVMVVLLLYVYVC